VSTATNGHDSTTGTAPARRPVGRITFLAVMLVVLVIYTQMGFEMEWITAAGRIGPGFFPRIIGGLAVLLTIIALLQSLRPTTDDEGDTLLEDEDAGEADLGRHPKALAIMVAASAALAAVFASLGAIVACALFLFGTLWVFNRQHLVANLAVSIGLPVAVYLLFQTALNAGLPEGVLPSF
jgi:putative tricarboxylic transport membrane protein